MTLVYPGGADAADMAVVEWTYHYGVSFKAVDSVYFFTDVPGGD
jgi:hypothetical protein